MHPEDKDSKQHFAAETLGRRIASRRALAGMSQEEVGTALGVTRQYVSMMERDTYVPSTALLIRLAAMFGVTETWLLHGSGSPAPQRRPELSPAFV